MASQPPDDGSRRPQSHSFTTTSTTTTTHGAQPSTTTTHSSTGGHGTSVQHFGPQSTTITHPTVTTSTHTPIAQQFAHISADVSRSNSGRNRSSSIRIRRPSTQNLQPSPQPVPLPQHTPSNDGANDGGWQGGRRRSSSEPRPPPSALFPDDNDLRRQMTATPLQPLYEESSRAGNAGSSAMGEGPPVSQGLNARRQGGMSRQTSALNIRRHHHHHNTNKDNMMDTNVVDVLDVIGTSPLLRLHAPLD